MEGPAIAVRIGLRPRDFKARDILAMMCGMRRLLPVLALALAAACAGAPKVGVRAWQGSDSGVPAIQHVVAQDEAQWRALWERLEKPAPPADFATHFGVAAFIGDKRSGDYHFRWSYQTSADRMSLTIGYLVERSGSADGPRTRPYAVFLFPRAIAKPGAQIVVEDKTPGGAAAL